MASATRELLAGADDVWSFLAEPHHLPDWWPGVLAVDPDRRGLAPGARWQVARRAPRGLLRLPDGGLNGAPRRETLLVDEVVPGQRWRWRLVSHERRLGRGAPLAASVELEPQARGRTRVTVQVASRGLGSADRFTARAAVERLYTLVQTAAEP